MSKKPVNKKPQSSKNKTARRVNLKPDMPTPDASRSDEVLALLGTHVWRLGLRIAAAPEVGQRIKDSHADLSRDLELLGIRVDDPTGSQFNEGMNADIVAMPDGADPSREILKIADVLRPAVYVDRVCIIPPQIIVERAPKEAR